MLLALHLAVLAILFLVACGDHKKPHAAWQPTATCTTDAECDSGRCDPFAGCADCLFDGDCGDDARCVQQTCHAVVSCAADADCERGSCDTSAERCVECGSDRDCGKAERCVEEACVASLSCQSDTDCDAGKRCDTRQAMCAACLDDGDCANDAACSAGKCVARCDSNNDCPSVYHCADRICTLDVCEAGAVTCSSNGNARALCSDAGDALDVEPCGVGRSCSIGDDTAACQRFVCTPEQWTCVDTTAELCSADGLDVARSVDCGADRKVCDHGKCVAKLCEPGTQRCDGSAVVRCSASGASESSRLCADDERCDPETLECVAKACEPGARGCVEETIATCNEDGSAFDATGEDCAASQMACWEGECRAVVCSAGFSCGDGGSLECTDNRTRLVLAQACTLESGKFCSAESGHCQPFVCEPTLPVCNADLATSCANDGSRPLDFGIDCLGLGKVCWAADCLPTICEPDSYACVGSDLKHCINRGTAFAPVKTCGAGTVCDEAVGTCRLQKCVPNQPACDGMIATACDATGLGYAGTNFDCSVNGDVCVDGACRPVICTPGATFCESNELRKCGPTGGSYQALDICATSEFCDLDRVACVTDSCTAGSPVCSGTFLTTCDDDGSGPLPGGTDCATTNEVCDLAACRALICAPNARFCESGDVVLCNERGTDFAPYDNCRAREFCDESLEENEVACSVDLCPQGGNGCAEERLATCNADGSGYANVGTDCSLTANVCDLGGTCTAVALDDLGAGGAAVPFAGSAIHFGLFRMLTPRTLVKIEAPVVPSVVGPVTWVVYRSAGALGEFTLLNQQTSPGAVVAGYTSSASLDFPLEQGAFYLLGVAVKGPHDTAVLEGSSPSPVSFGQMLGGFTYNAGAVPTIPNELVVGAGAFADGVGLRVSTAHP